MKRHYGLYHKIYSMENLRLAEKKARRGKTRQKGIRLFDKDPDNQLASLQLSLQNKTYRTSSYEVFTIQDPKERLIYRLPYFPDRILHHAVMNVIKPIFVASFTADTYSCIEKRGIHGASFNLRRALVNQQETQYCLKIDITKFYPSIDHEILKRLLRKKFKDANLLGLLDEIIDSAPGLPIGNYLSQYLANFYLCYFDHWIKEQLGVKFYFRYCDDLVILHHNKQALHSLRQQITAYLDRELKLKVKANYQVFPVSDRGIDFVGYVHYHGFTLLRKSIKMSMARAVARNATKSVASYYGWAKYCNSKNLLKKLNMLKFSELGIEAPTNTMTGKKIHIYEVLNRPVEILGYSIKPSKFEGKGNGKCLHIQAVVDKEKRVIFSGSGVLMDMLERVPKESFPFSTTIVKEDQRLVFT